MIYVAYLTHGIQIKYKTDSSDEFNGIIFWNDIVMPQDILKNIHTAHSMEILWITWIRLWTSFESFHSLVYRCASHIYIYWTAFYALAFSFYNHIEWKNSSVFNLHHKYKINENKSTIWSDSLLDNVVASLVQP